MQNANVEINILINGRKATEYQSPMDFQTYIEGRDGSEFEIEFVNNNHHDVEAILSIDGLSIIDGKPAGSQSGGYVVNARSRMTIPGWMVDGATAARFAFAGSKGGSYVEQSGGDSRNKGVIGAKVYARKYSPPAYTARPSVMRGLTPKGMHPTFGSPLGNSGGFVYSSNSAMPLGSYSADSSVSSTMTSSATMNNATPGTLDFSDAAYTVAVGASAPVEQTLGTEFGKATDFATQEVKFERGDIVAVMVVYYDDRQGLKRRGIDVSRTSARPSAFPADETGCQPPIGWTK
jgi:hypothetical protein